MSAGAVVLLLAVASLARAQSGPSLSVSASGPATAAVNTNVTYSITATNNGPGNATGVTVTAILPTGFSFVPSGSTLSCSDNAGTVTCAVGGLGAGVSSALTVIATAASSGTKKAVFGVVGNEGDPNLADNSAVVTTTINGSPTITGISPATGTAAGGTTVTITGTSLISGTTVTIGGAAATVTGGSPPTTITAVTPAHSCGTVDVVVSNSGGTATLTGGFYYGAPPSPTGLTPNGTILAGSTTSVTLAWSPTPNATRYAVRLRDNTDGTLRDSRNNCPTNTIYLCVDGLTTTSITVPVLAGHSYDWWVHSGNACQYSVQTNASFSVAACQAGIAATPGATPGDRLWGDDQVPAGAIAAGIWTWDTTQKASGTQSHTEPATAGVHQHYFYGATATPTYRAGEKLVAYVLVDPCNPPQEVMLQWNDGTWEHRAFWGQDFISWGTSGTVSRRYEGALPAAGQWVRLEVPVEDVGLAGRPLNGMAFTLFGGRAWFDRSGAGPAAPAAQGLYMVVPCRVIDTRFVNGAYGSPALQPSSLRTFALAGRCAVPSTAKSVEVNVTIVNPTGNGFLNTYPADIAPPGTGLINFSAGQTRANNATISVSSDGTASVTVATGSGGTVDLIVDVIGYAQ